jgi:hypothetical protein
MRIDPPVKQSKMQDIIIYKTEDGKANVVLLAKDGMVWMNQNQLAELFDTSKQNIGQHVASILKENELDVDSVVKNYFTTAADGKEYNVTFYSLEMILAIGFRVKSKRGTQFRIWANRNLKEYMVKGFLMDDERLKNPDGRPDYFDELLARIRDIRASEKRFYQKVRDLFALCSDYDSTDKATQMFFTETQNKLLFAVTSKTAAELIVARASPEKENMGLTSWKGAIVRKQDIIIAKNYLSEDEIDTLNRLVVIFLETAELTVKERTDLTLAFWKENVDRLLNFQNRNILKGTGTISNSEMEVIVGSVYEDFNQQRKYYDAMIADQYDMEEITKIESQLNKRKKD